MKYEDIVKKWQQIPISDSADIELKLHNFRILFAYNSGKLENENIKYKDTCDIFENSRVTGFEGDIRILFEQQNQKDCYELLKRSVVKKEPFSTELIKNMHFELSKGIYDEILISRGEKPGEYKKIKGLPGLNGDSANEADIENKLEEMFENINSYNGIEIIRAAAYIHAMMEVLRPFAAKNASLARMMMNYYLIINNHPPIVIFQEDKKKYSRAIEAFIAKKDIEPLIAFLKNQFEKTWSVGEGHSLINCT